MSFDHRRHERYDFPDTIEYVLDPYTTDEIFNGIAVDISNYGMCLLTSTPPTKGQEITIKTIIPASSQKAVVLWIEKYDDVFYKVGLVFV